MRIFMRTTAKMISLNKKFKQGKTASHSCESGRFQRFQNCLDSHWCIKFSEMVKQMKPQQGPNMREADIFPSKLQFK